MQSMSLLKKGLIIIIIINPICTALFINKNLKVLHSANKIKDKNQHHKNHVVINKNLKVLHSANKIKDKN